mmetsp:Transcript_2808/g.6839  ORF Transcript_2808/g.6839 Transcript_2808/m.6839 type:complete len:359 (-) Transcript_2808:329-1405(-)
MKSLFCAACSRSNASSSPPSSVDRTSARLPRRSSQNSALSSSTPSSSTITGLRPPRDRLAFWWMSTPLAFSKRLASLPVHWNTRVGVSSTNTSPWFSEDAASSTCTVQMALRPLIFSRRSCDMRFMVEGDLDIRLARALMASMPRRARPCAPVALDPLKPIDFFCSFGSSIFSARPGRLRTGLRLACLRPFGMAVRRPLVMCVRAVLSAGALSGLSFAAEWAASSVSSDFCASLGATRSVSMLALTADVAGAATVTGTGIAAVFEVTGVMRLTVSRETDAGVRTIVSLLKCAGTAAAAAATGTAARVALSSVSSASSFFFEEARSSCLYCASDSSRSSVRMRAVFSSTSAAPFLASSR